MNTQNCSEDQFLQHFYWNNLNKAVGVQCPSDSSKMDSYGDITYIDQEIKTGSSYRLDVR